MSDLRDFWPAASPGVPSISGPKLGRMNGIDRLDPAEPTSR